MDADVIHTGLLRPHCLCHGRKPTGVHHRVYCTDGGSVSSYKKDSRKPFYCAVPRGKGVVSTLACNSEGTLYAGVGSDVYAVSRDGLSAQPVMSCDSEVQRVRCMGSRIVALCSASVNVCVDGCTLSLPLPAPASDWCLLPPGTLLSQGASGAEAAGAGPDTVAVACGDASVRLFVVPEAKGAGLSFSASIPLSCTCITPLPAEQPGMLFSDGCSVSVIVSGRTHQVCTSPRPISRLAVQDVTGDGALELVLVSGEKLTVNRILPGFSVLPVRVPDLQGVVDVMGCEDTLYVAVGTGSVSIVSLGQGSKSGEGIVRKGGEAKRLQALQERISQLEVKLSAADQAREREREAEGQYHQEPASPSSAAPYPSLSVRVTPSLRSLSLSVTVSLSVPFKSLSVCLPETVVCTSVEPEAVVCAVTNGCALSFASSVTSAILTLRLPQAGAGGDGRVLVSALTQSPVSPCVVGVLPIPILPFHAQSRPIEKRPVGMRVRGVLRQGVSSLAPSLTPHTTLPLTLLGPADIVCIMAADGSEGVTCAAGVDVVVEATSVASGTLCAEALLTDAHPTETLAPGLLARASAFARQLRYQLAGGTADYGLATLRRDVVLLGGEASDIDGAVSLLKEGQDAALPLLVSLFKRLAS
ncbi:hypothetical protein KIPB_000903 [Kipferlia bialata]|uniref:Uncharacterized protein n=1 Tax=Kipferlia bialata TaxID=797122 RepID=A0A9K3CPW9_9EUKA|nr:hypothetical protein KIPB_000903 [Kipferlia bialata]|eukprot:g903.t1